jgi:UDP-N-acetylmuramoylalanine--D-glutamate ligase
MGGEDYRGRRVLVVGLARSGLAAAKLLLGRGARVRANDARTGEELSSEWAELADRGVEVITGSHPAGLTVGIELVVVSPGVPSDAAPLLEARREEIPVWGELELAYREIEGPIVAVTGTKGKSTTATLIAQMLERAGHRVALGGNIGRPLSLVVQESPIDSTFVVEVSSFQLESIERFRPRVAVLLNVTPDHLDRHPSFEVYREAKERIFSNQEREDWAVVYGANPLTREMATRIRSRKIFYSLECMGDGAPHLCVEDGWIVRHEDSFTDEWIPLERVRLPGKHNVENVMAAAAASHVMGVESSLMSEVVGSFRGIPHALERIGEIRGVSFYDDSKATNVAAAQAAIASFEGNVVLVLGGRSKGANFEVLREDVKGKVKLVLSLGESREQIAEALSGQVPVLPCAGLREVVERAFAHAEPGDTVLFSPACASFDMFADYAERGRLFKEEVRRLEKSLADRGDGDQRERKRTRR